MTDRQQYINQKTYKPLNNNPHPLPMEKFVNKKEMKGIDNKNKKHYLQLSKHENIFQCYYNINRKIIN